MEEFQGLLGFLRENQGYNTVLCLLIPLLPPSGEGLKRGYSSGVVMLVQCNRAFLSEYNPLKRWLVWKPLLVTSKDVLGLGILTAAARGHEMRVTDDDDAQDERRRDLVSFW